MVIVQCVLVFLISACNNINNFADNSDDKIVFMAGYKPQANLPFAVAYVAKEKGFFEEQNLDVEILHANTGEHLQMLMVGEVDYTTAAAESVLKRRSSVEPEIPIVALALFGQNSQQSYVALEESNIKTPKDWEGRTFGYKISVPPNYLAILDANDVNRNQINEVRVGFDPRVLTEGKVDILAVFKSNEPNTLRKLGFGIVEWSSDEYEIPGMGLTYITTQETVDSKKDVTRRFLTATMKSLYYVIDNPEEALGIVMEYAPNADREHQRFMLNTEIADSFGPITELNGLGSMADYQWKELYEHLLDHNVLNAPFDYTNAFTTEFLEDIYKTTEFKQNLR